MSAVPLAKYAEFRRVCKTAADWYRQNPDHIEFADPTWVLLSRSGEIAAYRGGPEYMSEVMCRRWKLARIDADTDPASCDTEDLKAAWQERGELVVEVIAGGRCITIAERDEQLEQ